MFVQDFVPVERPFEHVLAEVRAAVLESSLSPIVRDAWVAEQVAAGTSASAVLSDGHRVGALEVQLAAPRVKESCLVVPMQWTGDDVAPLLDGDLEFVRFGAEQTHLGVSARSPVTPAHWTQHDDSDRLLVAVVRHFLLGVSAELIAAVDHVDRASTRSSAAPRSPRCSATAMMGG